MLGLWIAPTRQIVEQIVTIVGVDRLEKLLRGQNMKQQEIQWMTKNL
jgi:hypothetical protein